MYIFMYILDMAKRCSVADARKDLSALLTQAEAGVEVEITRRGKPVAVLVSIQEYQRIKGRRSAFKQAYEKFATSHDLGQNFGKAFNVTFQNEAGERDFVWQTSWGVSTRLVGALIMSHSDDDGLARVSAQHREGQLAAVVRVVIGEARGQPSASVTG